MTRIQSRKLGNKMPHLTKIKKGQSAELSAEKFLIDDGHDVYINRHGIGPVDLVATKDGEIKLFDVKCESYRSDDGSRIARSLTSEQIKLNVRFIFVNDKEECRIA